ncbi:tRNA methyltransferase complex GCD14 subunit-domain-containing protein [Gorgonomyces haynaldii]|nr:tRNA methyltransferase complex GCD14 subunit-domain-containing protein [Gorgonomyces haynaldii]
MFEHTQVIQEGDTVICYVNPMNMKAVQIKKGDKFSNQYGQFDHETMIGKTWGSKITSVNKRGFMYLLRLTPELWTLNLPHRTQILYNPDISAILSNLDVQPGTKMIESGTGSGSFSHSIARIVAPDGHLYSFEYHKARVELATQEFKEHGLEQFITVKHRDVCEQGFDLKNTVTAVFLDLPKPWDALASAKEAFIPDRVGKICCFSPAIEQVQETCKKLHELGFEDIRMIEVLSRPYDVRKIAVPPVPDTIVAKPQTGKKRRLDDDEQGILTAKPVKEVKGHTSFLTFATLFPQNVE